MRFLIGNISTQTTLFEMVYQIKHCKIPLSGTFMGRSLSYLNSLELSTPFLPRSSDGYPANCLLTSDACPFLWFILSYVDSLRLSSIALLFIDLDLFRLPQSSYKKYATYGKISLDASISMQDSDMTQRNTAFTNQLISQALDQFIVA